MSDCYDELQEVASMSDNEKIELNSDEDLFAAEDRNEPDLDEMHKT